MAAAGFAACMGGKRVASRLQIRRLTQNIALASPEIITQAAEIGIEHNLGLTCDPVRE